MGPVNLGSDSSEEVGGGQGEILDIVMILHDR